MDRKSLPKKPIPNLSMSKGNRMVGLAVKSSDRPERGSPECMLVHFDLGLTGLLFLTFFSFFFWLRVCLPLN